jgi:hypothetical protein
MRQMIDASTPELPDDPTPEQCDAWIELSAILNDPDFVANMRSNAKDFWDHDAFDPAAYQRESEPPLLQARQAIAQGNRTNLRNGQFAGSGMAGNVGAADGPQTGPQLQDLVTEQVCPARPAREPLLGTGRDHEGGIARMQPQPGMGMDRHGHEALSRRLGWA